MELYCERFNKKTKWDVEILKDINNNLYQVYVCKCYDGSRVCQEDKHMIDIGDPESRENGIKIGNLMADAVTDVAKDLNDGRF